MSERDVFTAARDITDPALRAAYLDGACAGATALRERVEALLRAHDRPDSLLDVPAVSRPTPEAAATRDYRAPGAAPADGPTRTHGDGTDDDTADALGFLDPPGRPDSLGRIGHHEVLEVLGKGGFGIVFRAFDELLQRVVAVKVLAPSLAVTSPARKRFLREARSSARVRHENVVQVHAVEEHPLPYLVMEFVPGETLQQRLDRTGPLEVADVLRIGRQVAEGLAAAHETGLIHRDIKPSNILIGAGSHEEAKITDFGLARAADDASLTRSGVVAGTPMYMAPEQARGETLDHRADLFSLGSVLYTMLSGRPPFRAENTPAVLRRVADDTPRPIREIIPEVPEWLCRIVEKLHAKNPAERFRSAKEVADVLADCEAQVAAHKELRDFTRIPGGKPTPPQGMLPHPAVVAAALLLPVAVVVLLRIENSAPARAVSALVGVLVSVVAVGLSRHLGRLDGAGPAASRRRSRVPVWAVLVCAAAGTFATAAVLGQRDLYDEMWMFLVAPPLAAALVSLIPWRSSEARVAAGLPARARRWKWAAAVAAVLLAVGGIIAAVETLFGEPEPAVITILTNDPKLVVTLDGQLVVFTQHRYPDGVQAVHDGSTTVGVAPGQHRLWAMKDGKLLREEVFTVAEGEARTIDLTTPRPPPWPAGDGWVSLFNGKDLTGWKTHPDQPGKWTVQDGHLTCTGPPNAIFSEHGNFKDFHLRVEAKLDAGQSMLWFRRPFELNGDPPEGIGALWWPKGFGAVIGQVSHGLNGSAMTGSLFTYTTFPRQLIKPGEWFTLEVVARGDHIQVFVNQEKTADYEDDDGYWARGHVALAHSEIGTRVFFRKVEIKELPAGTTADGFVPLFNGKDTTGWTTFSPGNWMVENGVLIGTAFDVLKTNKEFENFHLRAEVKVNAGGLANLGVIKDRAATVRIGTNEADRQRTGTLIYWDRVKEFPTLWDKEVAGGDGWHTVEMIVRGKTVTAIVNGIQTAETTLPGLPTPAPIYLEPLAAGTVVQCRKIEIRELTADEVRANARAATPFVVAGVAGTQSGFATLVEAVAVAKGGDTIEVRGNGPFDTTRLDLRGRALTIRAGTGFRPVIRFAPEDAGGGVDLIVFDAPLRLEGLEFQAVARPNSSGCRLLTSYGAPIAAANCRFLLKNQTEAACLQAKGSPRCDFRNCEFLVVSRGFGVVVDYGSPARGEIRLENCVQVGDYFTTTIQLHRSDTVPRNDTIRLTQNTLIAAAGITVAVYNPQDLAAVQRGAFVTARRNVFDLGYSLVHLSEQDKEKPLGADGVKRLNQYQFEWKEEGNQFALKNGFLSGAAGHLSAGPKTVADWETFWGVGDTRSRLDGAIRYRVLNPALMAATRPEQVKPDDFRLMPDSAGGMAGLDGRVLGADVDLVGPGAPYEKWRKSEDYARWLAGSDGKGTAAEPAPPPRPKP